MTVNDLTDSQDTQRKLHWHEGRFGRSVETLIKRTSSVGDHTFFDTDEFPWTMALEQQWHLIRAELDGLIEERDSLPHFQDVSPRQYAVTKDNNWKTFFFCVQGYRAEKNCERCPETARLLEAVPGILTAFFSILAPQKYIAPHRGRFTGVLRYHLGLIVPQPAESCWIRVGDDLSHWEEGKSMIFDDTYYHEVRNDTDSWRAVLLVDFLRPLPFPVSVLSRAASYAISKRKSVKDMRSYLENHQ